MFEIDTMRVVQPSTGRPESVASASPVSFAHILKRLVPSALYRRLADRVARQLAQTCTQIDIDAFRKLPLEHLLSHYYAVSELVVGRINQQIPHFKLRQGQQTSFYDFVRLRIPRDRPVRVLDLGAGDGYLAWQLSAELHPDSRFDCVDIRRPSNAYVNDRVRFIEMDAASFARDEHTPQYDCAIAAGLLGLLSEEDRDVVFSLLGRVNDVFVREVPLVTNIVDAYCYDRLDQFTPWYRNFTEASLKASLMGYSLDVLSFEHEHDMYVHATGSGSRDEAPEPQQAPALVGAREGRHRRHPTDRFTG